MRVEIRPDRLVRTGTGRYTVLLVGLGAAGVAIGWLGPELRRDARRVPLADPARR
ncbi:hypothetical protein [Actinomadura oligospora]|uniref:hypothetical protein n=1 Tax=Actinomadura oligospora TaxID=111804 RepID=UPI0012F836DD|nr:hypothetical protein [Actinomadura oligospora]